MEDWLTFALVAALPVVLILTLASMGGWFGNRKPPYDE